MMQAANAVNEPARATAEPPLLQKRQRWGYFELCGVMKVLELMFERDAVHESDRRLDDTLGTRRF